METNHDARDRFGMHAKGSSGCGPALVLNTIRKRFTLSVQKKALKDVPRFDKDDWPSMADPSWASGVHKFYGPPYGRS